MIKGTWHFGNKGTFLTPNGEKSFDDTSNEALFYDSEMEYDLKPKLEIKKIKVIKCDVRCPKTKDIFSALIKKGSAKTDEMIKRFPKAWDDFVNKGGGFGDKDKEKEAEKIKMANANPETKIAETKDNSTPAEEIELLKKEYEGLEDKRCARGKEINVIIKHLESK